MIDNIKYLLFSDLSFYCKKYFHMKYGGGNRKLR